ncbi:hypothetical protein CT0861_03579 [Colletotrichum tofieldiae]|uniref:Uncharacterized protein n=1 Tax=Colletotrichum tofieldiae TaxID=708197 RepID=A0A166U4F0_9PEZI|nr:hypothetical protein CT0861_03579 [Colletotrichum tofieldiae]
MYQTAQLPLHLQLAPSPHPGNEGYRNAAPQHSLSRDSDNESNWSDSEFEEPSNRDIKPQTGIDANAVSRRKRQPSRLYPVVNETYADQGDWNQNQYARRPGGQAVPYHHHYKPVPPAEDPYIQPQQPLGSHPQVQQHPPQEASLPPGQNNMEHENPFAPRPVLWNGHPARPYGNIIPPPGYESQPVWPSTADYLPPNLGPSYAAPPPPYPYTDPRTQYPGGDMHAQYQPVSPPIFETAPPPPPRRRRRPPMTGVPPQEQDFEHLQRRLRAVEIENRQEKNLRQAQDQAERQKLDMNTKVDQLRKDIERSFRTEIRDAVNDIRREIQLSQSESQSEPGRAPSRMDSSRRGYTATARSVHGDRGFWAEREGEGQDVLMQEIAQFIEGKRKLQPQAATSGAAFGNGAQAGPGSARGSRIDPELRSELETIVYDMLGGSDIVQRHHRRPSSRPMSGRAASDGYEPRAAPQVDPRGWHHETYNGGMDPAPANPFVSRRSSVRVAFDQNGYARPSAAPNRPTDERDWLGVPRKSRRSRPRREDAGESTAPRMQNASLPQQPPPPQTQPSNPRNLPGTNAQDPRFYAQGGNGEAAFSGSAMAYQGSINHNGMQEAGLGNPARPPSRHGGYRHAAPYEDDHVGDFFTEDESDDSEVFPKRDASYPVFPAGHPDLRHQVQLPRAPEPGPYLRQAGI